MNKTVSVVRLRDLADDPLPVPVTSFMLTWLELFLASSTSCLLNRPHFFGASADDCRIQTRIQIDSEKHGLFSCRYRTYFQVPVWILGNKSSSAMPLSAVARTAAADLRVCKIVQNKALSPWITSALVLPLDVLNSAHPLPTLHSLTVQVEGFAWFPVESRFSCQSAQFP